MDARHMPTDLKLFRYDLRRAHVVSVDSCHGTTVTSCGDCLPLGQDEISLVIEPSLVMSLARAGGHASLRAIRLDEAIRIEIDRGSSDASAWVRDPNGVWRRYRPQY